MNRIIRLSLAAALTLLLTGTALPQTPAPPRQEGAPAAERLLALLEKTGYDYRKSGEGVWVVTLAGKNVKEIDVVVQPAEESVALQSVLTERKAVADKPGLLLKLLELNHEFDTVKFAVSPEMLYARAEVPLRTLDVEYLKYLINQLASLVDESEPQVRPFLKAR